jgi:hypothetical protein
MLPADGEDSEGIGGLQSWSTSTLAATLQDDGAKSFDKS